MAVLDGGQKRGSRGRGALSQSLTLWVYPLQLGDERSVALEIVRDERHQNLAVQASMKSKCWARYQSSEAGAVGHTAVDLKFS